MAKYFTPMDNFDEVEMYYRNTKPVRKRDPELKKLLMWQDMRPTNCRDRQLESVRKISRNKYALCDYDTYWSLWVAEFRPEKCTDIKEFNDYIEAYAPILWERKRNGDEVMTVRNVSNYGMYTTLPIGRVDFLDRHLPRHWWVRSEAGNQYIKTPMADFVLPKNTFLPKMMRKPAIANQHYDAAQTVELFGKMTCNAQTCEDKKLVFVRRDGKWLSPDKVYRPLKWRIDTKSKKKLQPVVRNFVTANLPMMAMLKDSIAIEDEDVKALVRYLDGKLLAGKIGEWGISSTVHCLNKSRLPPDKTVLLHKEILDIMRNPEHGHALGLVKHIAKYIAHCNSESDDIRALVNKWVNNFFNLRHKIEA